MDRRIQALLNRISFISATIATLIILSLLLYTPDTCISHTAPSHSFLKFPKSTCDFSHRSLTTLDKKNRRLWSTSAWINKVNSFSLVFLEAQRLAILSNSSKSLCLLAGAGQEVMALNRIGVSDVTGIDLVDSPPLVSRADPHNLPFFDDIFDFAFSAQFDVVLFPSRFITEMERTVRVGGFCLLVVEERGDAEVKEIGSLFRRGTVVDAKNVMFSGMKMTRIVVRIKNLTST